MRGPRTPGRPSPPPAQCLRGPDHPLRRLSRTAAPAWGHRPLGPGKPARTVGRAAPRRAASDPVPVLRRRRAIYASSKLLMRPLPGTGKRVPGWRRSGAAGGGVEVQTDAVRPLGAIHSSAPVIPNGVQPCPERFVGRDAQIGCCNTRTSQAAVLGESTAVLAVHLPGGTALDRACR